jgi:hypothetical protein
MEAREQKPNVVVLSGPRMPADQGLSSLGLLMQLAGTIFLGFTSVMSVTFVITAGMAGGAIPGLWVIFLALGSSAVRSAFHRAAGTALIYGHPQGPLAPTRTYVIVSLVQTLIVLALLKTQLELPGSALFTFGSMLLAWPLTLAVVISRPRYRRFREELPIAEDKGFEGAAVFMTLGGAVGSLLGLFLLYMLVQAPKEILLTGPVLLILAVVVALLIRSIFHFQAGRRIVNGTTGDEASAGAERYFNFGIVSSWLVGGALLLQMVMSGPSMPAMLIISMVVYTLLAWPQIVRRFFSERQFADLMAGNNAPLHQRAPDLGLTALGWLLLAQSVQQLANSLPGALFTSSASEGGLWGELLNANAMPSMLGMTFAGHSPFWSVGLAGIGMWAGIELVRMSDNYRVAATIYGVVTAVVTIYLLAPLLKEMGNLGLLERGNAMGSVSTFFFMAIALAAPIATLVLVNRRGIATATARVRGGGGEPPSTAAV